LAALKNKAVITSFVEEVLNQGRLERIDDLVALNFVELDRGLTRGVSSRCDSGRL